MPVHPECKAATKDTRREQVSVRARSPLGFSSGAHRAVSWATVTWWWGAGEGDKELLVTVSLPPGDWVQALEEVVMGW